MKLIIVDTKVSSGEIKMSIHQVENYSKILQYATPNTMRIGIVNICLN